MTWRSIKDDPPPKDTAHSLAHRGRRMTDLDRLIEAVEVGLPSPTNWRNFMALAGEDVDGTPFTILAHRAYHGSLDAAHRLHDALLPGWDWLVRKNGWCSLHSPDFESVTWEAGDHVRTDVLAGVSVVVSDVADPARAWLLAILRALKGQEKANG